LSIEEAGKEAPRGIAEFAGLEFAGLENDGVEQKQRYILHTKKNFYVYDM